MATAPPTTFDWKQLVALVDEGGVSISYRYQADAVPLLIGPRAPRTDGGCSRRRVDGRRGRHVRSDTTADRVIGTDPLVGRFQITIPPGDLDVLDDVPERYLAYPVSVED